MRRASLLGLLLAAAGAAPEDRALKVAMVPQDSPVAWQAQLLGEAERPVEDPLSIGAGSFPAKVNAKGHLELDLRRDGKPRTLTGKREIVTISVKGAGEKPRTVNAKFEFKRGEQGWTLRNLTVLRTVIDREIFVVVDWNANGVWNESGKDGLAWEGRSWLFPLPASEERWCSATMEFSGLSFGPLGESPQASGRPLATTVPAALPILKGVNEERVEIGLTPRPEDPKLSAELQKHCVYMAMNGILTHPEDKGKPGYSPEGHAAGMRSILGRGHAADAVASGMVHTYFHRQDVIRPTTTAFGVGIEGAFTGIDGRSALGPAEEDRWPVLCPVPGQSAGTHFASEAPDPVAGDREAGFPVTVYFGTSKLKLLEAELRWLGPAGQPTPPAPKGQKAGQPVDCYAFDPQSGAHPDMTRFQKAVCLIAKDPLKSGAEYEVSFHVDVDGRPWKRSWRFNTAPRKPAR